MTPPDTKTPRTDAAVFICHDSGEELVRADFARTLERELAEANKHLAVTARNSLLFMQERNALQADLTAATQRIAELEAHAERLAEQLVFSLKMSKHNPYFIAARHAEAESVLADYRAAKETKLP